MTDLTIRGYESADWESAADLFLQPRCIWGTLRNFCLRDGMLVDAHHMARLKS